VYKDPIKLWQGNGCCFDWIEKESVGLQHQDPIKKKEHFEPTRP
jgi:hypothetical protein